MAGPPKSNKSNDEVSKRRGQVDRDEEILDVSGGPDVETDDPIINALKEALLKSQDPDKDA